MRKFTRVRQPARIETGCLRSMRSSPGGQYKKRRKRPGDPSHRHIERQDGVCQPGSRAAPRQRRFSRTAKTGSPRNAAPQASCASRPPRSANASDRQDFESNGNGRGVFDRMGLPACEDVRPKGSPTRVRLVFPRREGRRRNQRNFQEEIACARYRSKTLPRRWPTCA